MLDNPQRLSSSGKRDGEILGKGEMTIHLVDEYGAPFELRLDNVAYCPTLKYTIVGAIPLTLKFGAVITVTKKSSMILNSRRFKLYNFCNLLRLPNIKKFTTIVYYKIKNTIKSILYISVPRNHNPRVGGSSPSSATIISRE